MTETLADKFDVILSTIEEGNYYADYDLAVSSLTTLREVALALRTPSDGEVVGIPGMKAISALIDEQGHARNCLVVHFDHEVTDADRRNIVAAHNAAIAAAKVRAIREGDGEAVGWETEAEWELEQRAFKWANASSIPEEARKTVEDLWRQYCLAATPAATGGEKE